MIRFRPIPGQVHSEFNHGWRLWVMIGSALLLLGLAVCTIGVAL